MTSLDVQTSVCQSFYYKHVVNYINFMIPFTPKLGCSDQTRQMYINLPSVIYCINLIHLNEIKLRIQNKLQPKLLSPQPLSKCYKPNIVERLGSISYKVCAFEKRKSSGFSATTKADSKISERTKITRFINACEYNRYLSIARRVGGKLFSHLFHGT